VIEVLSPATARYDRLVKRLRCQRASIREYWIVDLDAHVVERWRPEDERPEILAETLVWMPRGTEPGLTIDLLDLVKELSARESRGHLAGPPGAFASSSARLASKSA